MWGGEIFIKNQEFKGSPFHYHLKPSIDSGTGATQSYAEETVQKGGRAHSQSREEAKTTALLLFVQRGGPRTPNTGHYVVSVKNNGRRKAARIA